MKYFNSNSKFAVINENRVLSNNANKAMLRNAKQCKFLAILMLSNTNIK